MMLEIVAKLLYRKYECQAYFLNGRISNLWAYQRLAEIIHGIFLPLLVSYATSAPRECSSMVMYSIRGLPLVGLVRTGGSGSSIFWSCHRPNILIKRRIFLHKLGEGFSSPRHIKYEPMYIGNATSKSSKLPNVCWFNELYDWLIF